VPDDYRSNGWTGSWTGWRHKFHVILATPSGAKPAWLAAAHPEICRVNEQGLREPYTAATITAGPLPFIAPAGKNQLNAGGTLPEPSGAFRLAYFKRIQRKRYCDLCIGRFRDWLRERYEHSKTQPCLEQLFLEPYQYRLERNHAVGRLGYAIHWLERFATFQCCDFMKFEWIR
jgi:beta-galactosidase